MFEFKKICHEVEALSPEERTALLVEKAIVVVKRLHVLQIEGVDPVDALVSFLVGSAVSDGSLSEKDLLRIDPLLEQAFGEFCDVLGIEKKLKVSRDVRKEITKYSQELLKVISDADESLCYDILLICLLVTSVDGKITLKEQNYLRQICKEPKK